MTPLYGAHYLAEYWTDRDTYEWVPDWSRRPLAEVFDDAFEAIGRRSASFDYVLERSRGGARAPLFPDAHPFDALRIPTLHGVGWFDNITPPHMLDYETLMRNPATAPFQYLHAGSTDHENYRFEHVPIPESDDHAEHDDALERMLPRYIGPALDFFDAFLTRPQRPGGVPARALAPAARRLAGVAELAAAGRLRAPPLPRRGRARRRGRGRRLARPAPGERGEAIWLHDPADLVPSTLVNPFARSTSTPTSARSRRARTC